MLKKILSQNCCAKCKVCCEFGREDIWEIPLLSKELAAELKDLYSLSERGEGFVFNMSFDGDGLAICPALTDKGCSLGEKKPFDCKIWPLRVMRLGELLVITVSPVCNSVSWLPVTKVASFVAEIAETLYEAVEENPSLIKEYIDGYPIFSVKKENR